MVLYGLGDKPDTSYFPENSSKRSLDSSFFITNNFNLLTHQNIYAAGDNTTFALHDQIVRIPHYTEAINQGTFAGWNMMGKNIPYVTVPFFWTRIFNTSLCYTGFTKPNTEVVFQKQIDEKGNFLAFNCDENKCYSAMTRGFSHELILLNQALRIGLQFPRDSLN